MAFWKLPHHTAPSQSPTGGPDEGARGGEEGEEFAAAANAGADAAQMQRWRTEEGSSYCTARGCPLQTGMPCTFVDRHDRSCPTAWCPEHRVVLPEGIFCPTHSNFLSADTNLGLVSRPDLDDTTPYLLIHAVHQVEGRINALVEEEARRFQDTVVTEPVRFIKVGAERVRTWERAWKACSGVDIDLRISLDIEESHPETLVAKVNSQVVCSEPLPPAEVDEEEPAYIELGGRVLAAIEARVTALRESPEPEWMRHR